MPNFGTYQTRFVPKTSSFTVTDDEDVYLIDSSAGAVVVTLLSANLRFPNDANKYGRKRFVKTSSDTNPITLTAAGSDSVVGQSVIRGQNQSILLESDGISKWYNFAPSQTNFHGQVSVASADILALRATPKSLIAAPGANKVIIVNRILFKMTRTGTAYANGGALEFRYTDGSGAKVSADVAASVVTTGGAGTEINKVLGVEASQTPVANAAVILTCASAEFITGTGTAVVYLDYSIVDIA